jgi:glutaredoxin-like protein
MPMLSDKDRRFLEDYFEKSLNGPVTIKLFTQAISCQFCKETQQLMEEVAALSDKIELQVYNYVTDKEVVEAHGIRRIPATVIMGAKDYGIRFYGIPSGYEFNTLIEDIVAVGSEKHGLPDEVVAKLEQIQEPVHMQVFVTPTCPYCPTAVRTAHAFAMASDQITADMVEAVEFPQLSNRYGVMAVPKTIINEETELEGAAPPDLVVAHVLQALGQMSAEEVAKLMAGFEGELETT